MDLSNQKIVIIGGSSGIGLASAKAIVAAGGNVVIASRSEAKLNAAQAEIGERVTTFGLDITNEQEVQTLFATVGSFDALVITISVGFMGAFMELDSKVARQIFENKFWGHYYAAKYGAPQLKPSGAIVFFSGYASQKPVPNLSIMASVNGALEALARSLAVELSPIRVNVVSPGLVDTPIYQEMPAEQRQNYFNYVANSLPVKRIAQPEDIAETVLYLIKNKFTTGAVVDVDGGARLV
ncbi:SDR family oxidoreductase [Tolypothrix sp. PCC 7910]|uniref:SDR family oxidoreductase n=1 Tax=Tolypothrix sp. PCC 7910 TaxID=2099387 RepID=UPI001427944D|nr:SDR family oxidoreductase [Tolypothrix sp. PCC 7910]QIR39322.1 SDR family oxidoreductase [Tolypothrix sp. PCC 7910]